MTVVGQTPAKRRRRRNALDARPFVLGCWCVALAISDWFLTAPALAQTTTPHGVWLMDGRVAVETYDCDGLMCGRIVWLAVPRDAEGVLDADKNNPNPVLRERPLCGLSILWNLHPVGAD